MARWARANSPEDSLWATPPDFENPGDAAAPNWKAYLNSVPSDPWNQPYQYVYPGRQGEFDVFSYGADGQEGGEDINADIGNWDLD